MNNEEKILAMLENLTGKVDGLTNTVEKHGEQLAQVQQEQQQMRSDMSQMREEQQQMRSDMSQMREEQQQMRSDISQLREEQQQMRSDMSQMREEQQQMRSDMSQMREEQQQMRSDMSQMQATLTRVAVTQENVVIPQIKLLAEGHDTLLNTLARKDRVEALEDDMALLKTVIKSMSQRISELEKAQ